MRKNSLNILYLVVFIDMLGFGIVIPLLPYLVGKLGASGFFAASLLSVFSLMQMIFSPILGRLSDRYGKRLILIICLLGSFFSYALYSIGFLIHANTKIVLLIIFISRCVAGIMGANIPIAYAYVSDRTNQKQRTDAMGKIGAAIGLGFIVGPAVAILVAPYGQYMPGLIAAIMSILGFLVTALFLPEITKYQKIIESKIQDQKPIRTVSVLLNKQLVIIISITLLYSIAFVQMEALYSLYISNKYSISQQQIAGLFVYVGIVIAVSQGFLVGKLSRYISNISLLIFGILLLASSFILLSYTISVAGMLVASTGIALAAGAVNPSISTLISIYAPSGMQGACQGINQSSASLARVVGPLIAGYLYDAYFSNMPFLLGATLMLIALIMVFYLRNSKENSILTSSNLNHLTMQKGD